MRPSPWTLALVLLLPLLGGCLGASSDGSEAPANASAGPTAQGLEAEGGPSLTAAGFDVDGPLHRVTWVNGSFQPHQACNTGGCATGSSRVVVPLEGLPSGAVVQVRADLTFEEPETNIWAAPMDLSLLPGVASVYALTSTEEGGRERIEATFLQGGEPVALEVQYNGPTGATPPEAYQLRVEVHVEPAVLPPMVPVALPLAPGQALQLTPVGEGPVDLLVYGPDDTVAFSARREGGTLTQALPQTLRTGEFVLVLRPGSVPVTVATNGTASTLTPLSLRTEVGEPQPVTVNQPVAWSFEVSPTPLAAGLYAISDGPGGIAATLGRGEATLTGPSGPLAEGEIGCGTCITSGHGSVLLTPTGDPGLAPGSYEAQYTPDGSEGMKVGHLLVWYER